MSTSAVRDRYSVLFGDDLQLQQATRQEWRLSIIESMCEELAQLAQKHSPAALAEIVELLAAYIAEWSTDEEVAAERNRLEAAYGGFFSKYIMEQPATSAPVTVPPHKTATDILHSDIQPAQYRRIEMTAVMQEQPSPELPNDPTQPIPASVLRTRKNNIPF